MNGRRSRSRTDGERESGAALLRGAAVLAAAAVVSKLIGTLQKIPLQNLAGDTVFGIYNAVYPLYVLILFMATAGFPLVVSKFVSECVAAGRPAEAGRVLRVASIVLTGTGLVCFVLLYFGAETIAGWMGLPQTAPAIRSVSFALLVVPLMSALRGYYQGFQSMLPTAWSQIWEQTVRVATMFTLLVVLLGAGADAATVAAGATFGSVTGALAGLGVMLWYRSRETREKRADRGTGPLAGDAGGAAAMHSAPDSANAREGVVEAPGCDLAARPTRETADRYHRPQAGPPVPSTNTAGQTGPGQRGASAGESDWRLMRRLAAYALPLCLGTIAMPILTLTDSFTIPRLLLQRGEDAAGALFQFGLYNHGLPLVQLVAMIASSLSAAIVPAVAEARQRSDAAALRQLAATSLRLCWLLALPAASGLALLAEPINMLFYKTTEGSFTMALLSFTALGSAVNIIAASVLQGIGAVRAPALYLLLAAAVKAAGNVALVPRYGITGAAAAAVAAFALAGGDRKSVV